MSGGHYFYFHHYLKELADLISVDFQSGDPHRDGATDEEWDIILNEINYLTVDLIRCWHRSRELELFMSGDNGPTSYINNLKEMDIIPIQTQEEQIICLHDEIKQLKNTIIDLSSDLEEFKDIT